MKEGIWMELVRLQSTGDARFAPARALYEASFPAHEQREPASQRLALRNSAYHYTLLYDADVFVGLLLYWEAPAFLYIEHFCVDPALRNRRYGARALAALCAAGKPVILEIDPPDDALAMRRKRFYERCGFCENPYPHIHPPYHAGHAGHALVVMSSPAALGAEAYRDFDRYLRETVMRD